ncbi:uncharacterized protein EV422DRAFT_47627 [Fimicolochytrium jonesii]|uniref:uncharacterized protein n=1 Tax=Fimicolochytrium jonesii TaxID=1396493 RepID=UPI0022FE315A|nr:uncharacterized protein EV422DRAFT_47627 [Fimicolochytrium jonesii]KAI8820968.1 hypothetical protein EV422DRAFT_47627 [Fimicolochytrium jonesii]
MSEQIADYLTHYLSLCEEKDVFVVPSLRRMLEKATDGGPIPDAFKLNGNQPDLSYTRLSDSYIPVLLKPLAPCGVALRELDLGCNEIGDEGAKSIASWLKEDVTLESLNLRYNNIGPQGVGAIAQALQINEVLRSLDMSGNGASEEGGMEMANMLQLNTSLEALNLARTYLTATALIALSTVLHNNTSLITLNISNNYSARGTTFSSSVAADVMQHVTRMLETGNFTLRNVACAKMRICDDDVVNGWSTAVKANLRIAELDLSSNNITRDGGVALFRAMHSHPALVVVKLSSCSIKDEGADAVASMLENNYALQTLWIDYNGITGKGLLAIAKSLPRNQYLRRIAVWGNKWDVPACEAWAALIGGPLVDVTYDDDLHGRIVEPGETFPQEGRRIINVQAKGSAQAAAEKHGSNGALNQHQSPVKTGQAAQVKQRFVQRDVDVSFYAVEGVVHVARNESGAT